MHAQQNTITLTFLFFPPALRLKMGNNPAPPPRKEEKNTFSFFVTRIYID